MTTSGTTAFDLEFTEVAEEAWERVGREMRSGYDLRTARRSMNLLTLEWQNRGLNLWTIDSGKVDLVAGTASYDLPADTIALIEQVIRTDPGDSSLQSDLTISRINTNTYATIPNKLSQGRPIQVWVQRLRDAPTIHLWPVPDSSDYDFVYWRMRRVEDAGNGIETPDMNYRFYPALVAGLAYYIALKVPDAAPRLEMLRMEYERQYDLASQQDREKTSLRLVPHVGRV